MVNSRPLGRVAMGLMQRFKFRSITCLLTVLVVLVPSVVAQTTNTTVLSEGNASEVGMSAERLEYLDRVLERAIANEQTPGAIMLVARKGVVVYFKALGHRSLTPKPEPMTTDTVFDMASLTKVMATATSILVLVERGELALTDLVSDYLPDFSENGKESISLLHLLTHYSGLRPDVDLDEPWEGYSTAVFLGYQEKIIATPGERFIYSDINYFLLSEVVRQVSGIPSDDFASENIFKPLGMDDTRFNPPQEWLSRIAPTEWRDATMLRGKVHDPTASRMGGVAGHAGLFSTVKDTAIFAQMILNRGTYGSTRVLSPLSVDRMTDNQSPPGMDNWRGLGFDLRTRFSTPRGDLFPIGGFGHTGFTGTSLWIDPSTETFVVLFTNRLHPNGSGDVGSLRKKVASIVASSILEPISNPKR